MCGGRPTAACPPNQGTCRWRAAPAAECHWPAWRPPACSACRPWASAAWSCRSCSLPPQICVARTNFFAQIKNRTTQPTRICSRKKKRTAAQSRSDRCLLRSGSQHCYCCRSPQAVSAAPNRDGGWPQHRVGIGREEAVGVSVFGRCEQQQSTAQPWWSLGGEGRNRI